MSSVNKSKLTYSFLDFFTGGLYFFSLNALAGIFKTILKTRCKTGHSSLVSNQKEEYSVVKYDVFLRISVDDFNQVEKVPLYAKLL